MSQLNIRTRIYEDYLKKSRLNEYAKLLATAKNEGYKMLSIIDFYRFIRGGGTAIGEKILINRHDIDTSPNVAVKMFKIEKSIYGQNGSSTYYFRDCTFNKKIIQEIYNYGYEVGYHYEEIATFEKNNKLKNKNEILNHVPDIQKMFLDDYNNFRLKSEVPCYSVSSHGDFVNVKLNISNKVLLTSDEVRKKAGIVVEAYDDIIENNIKKRYADQEYLGFFSNNVIDSLLNGNSPILILTHPRQWKVDICENSKDNFRRLYQGLHYRFSK